MSNTNSSVNDYDDDGDSDNESLRFCLLGPPRVGKTSILRALLEEPFSYKYFSTVEVCYETIITKVNEKPVLCSLKDGPSAFQIVKPEQWQELIGDCHGVVYVIDVTNDKSLQELEDYVTKVHEINPDVESIMIGNKADDIIYQEIEEDKGNMQANKYEIKCGYKEVSAKKYFGVSEAISTLASRCIGTDNDDLSTTNSYRHSSSGLFSPIKRQASTESGASETSGASRRKRISVKLPVQSNKKKYATLGQWYVPLKIREEFLLKVKEKLGRGKQVLIYPPQGGSPSYVDLTLSYPYTCFTFTRQNGQKEIVVIDDISEIRPYTERSYCFKCMNLPRQCEGIDHLFTIIASEKSISLAATTAEDCIFLVKGLKLIMDCAIPSNIKKKRGKDEFSVDKLAKITDHSTDSINVEFAERIKFKLKQGIDVLFVKRNGTHLNRILSLDISEKRLVFMRRRMDDIAVQLSVVDSFLMYFEGPDPGMDVEDISELRPGYMSAIFARIEPPPDPSQEHLAFTIISSERSIGFLVNNDVDRQFLSTDFQTWLHMIRVSTIIY